VPESSSPFRALIFDLDGTLADSLEDIAGSMNVALATHGLPTYPTEAYRAMVGEGIGELVRRAVGARSDELLAAVAQTYRAAYRACGHAKTRIYPGIEALLTALNGRGVPLAVLSNKRDEFTRSLVLQHLSRWRFVEVRGEREGTPRKPDPTAALELAAALKTAPVDVAFVGDTAIDVRTARAAGMIPVGVLWGFRGRDELEAAGARHVLSSPAELLALA
jgi:phosphoglycolate phosphatase